MMKKWKRLLGLLLAMCLTATVLTSCGQKDGKAPENGPAAENTDQPSADAEGPIKVGISLYNLAYDFAIILKSGCEDALAELGKDREIEYSILDSRGDSAVQLGHIDTFISQGCDIIIMQPCDAAASTASVEAANAADIPVICVNNRVIGGDFVYVGSENIDAGRMQGEWIAENAPENATFVYATMPLGQGETAERRDGLMEVLQEKRPDIVCLADQSAEGMREQGMKLCEDWLQSYPDFTIYVAQTDSTALGALEVLTSLGKEKMVLGIDGVEEAVQKIASGEMSMSVFQNAHAQGYDGVMTAFSVLDGTFDGNDVIVPFEMITNENASEYLS